MSKRKSRTGLILMLLGGAMLLGAAGYMAANLYEEDQAGTASASSAAQIRLHLSGADAMPTLPGDATPNPSLPQATPSPEPGATPLPGSLPTEQPLYVQNPCLAMPEKVIDGQAYIGIMSIPKLGLELPVISEWSYPKLKLAPCRYTGSVYRDDMIICGHNYVNHFRRFTEMEEGDEITFTDMDGNVFRYEVIQKELIGRNDTEHMVSGEWDLTLFTCEKGGKNRVTLRCRRISKP